MDPSRKVTDFLLFATAFTVTWEKLYWDVAGKVNLVDILAALFVLAYLLQRVPRRDGRFPKTAAVVAVFFAAFLLVYLIGFYNLSTHQAFLQFDKGIGKFVLHFALLVAAIDYLAHRHERLYWRLFGWFIAGVVVNAVYGVFQLAAARANHNLDSVFIRPITGQSSVISLYGSVNGSPIYRMDALTADPNHLGIILDVPLLALVPIYLKLERGHRLRVPIAVLLAFFLLVELATLSRSGILGLAVGFVALALVYGRRLIASRQILVPLGAVALIGLAIVSRRQHFFETVLSSRLQRSYSSTGVHFQVYSFIPKILHMHPLFGLGFNNFAVYYEFVTGKKNWGPHSFYVATLVETGLVGTLLFAVFLVYLFRRLAVSLRLGRALAAAGDYDARLVRPFAWGLVAALLATMAANAFYLTMTFFYFYVLVLFVLALPVVYSRRLAAG